MTMDYSYQNNKKKKKKKKKTMDYGPNNNILLPGDLF